MVPSCLLLLTLLSLSSQSRFPRQTSNPKDSYTYVRPLNGQMVSHPNGFSPYRLPLAPSPGVQYSVTTNVQSSSSEHQYQPPLVPQPLPTQRSLVNFAVLLQRLQEHQQQRSDPESSYHHTTQTPLALRNAAQSMSITTSYTADVIRQEKADRPPHLAIQKAPASEIQGIVAKGSTGKDKASADDEYVVYYYYYYDDDTAGKNLSLNFDDIPNLEQYDSSKRGDVSKKVADRGARVQHTSPSNSVQAGTVVSRFSTTPSTEVVDDIVLGYPALSLSMGTSSPAPISNVYRYGNGDIPRVPVTPNIHRSFSSTRQPVTVTESSLTSTDPITEGFSVSPPPSTAIFTTLGSLTSVSSQELDDEASRVTEDTNDIEIDTHTEESIQETTETETTTTTDPTTIIEETTTTTERPHRRFSNRRRGSGGGRGNVSRAPSRSSTTIKTTTPTTTTTTTTTTTQTPSRRNGVSRFSSNRVRRPSYSSSRLRSRAEEAVREDETSTKNPSTPSVVSTSRRFGVSTQSRRFGSSRGGSANSRTLTSSTSTTTIRPTSRGRPTPASRSGSFVNSRDRNRSRSRPSFFRSRQQEEKLLEQEKDDTTTESSLETSDSSVRTDFESLTTTEKSINIEDEEDEVNDATITPTTTTGRNRAVFRPRPRPPLFNGGRSRPSPFNRPRSR